VDTHLNTKHISYMFTWVVTASFSLPSFGQIHVPCAVTSFPNTGLPLTFLVLSMLLFICSFIFYVCSLHVFILPFLWQNSLSTDCRHLWWCVTDGDYRHLACIASDKKFDLLLLCFVPLYLNCLFSSGWF
jgi:hypothetical protein